MSTQAIPTLRTVIVVIVIASASLPRVALEAATIPVTTDQFASIADGECSLEEALVAADTDTAYFDCPSGSGDDTIELSGAGTIEATRASTILTSIRIVGAGPHLRTISFNQGNNRLFTIAASSEASLELVGMTITQNAASPGVLAEDGGCFLVDDGGALSFERVVVHGCRSAGEGGAVMALNGTVTVSQSTFRHNDSAKDGGAIRLDEGSLIATDSTFHHNRAGTVEPYGVGGAIAAQNASVVLVRSTVSSNAATAGGGVISFGAAATLDIAHSTVTLNVAEDDSAAVPGSGGGLVVVEAASFTIINSAVAGNEASADSLFDDMQVGISPFDPVIVLSLGHNLIGNNSGSDLYFPTGDPNVFEDFVGEPSAVLDPLLLQLAANGGVTKTHQPAAGSPLIDQGVCPNEVEDQRGYGDPAGLARAVDDPLIDNVSDGCDIGSLENGATGPEPPFFADGFETGDTSGWSP